MSASIRPLRIAVGGFMHETNTFAVKPTEFSDFTITQQYPGYCSGPEMLAALKGRNLAAACFIEEAQSAGHEILPLSWSFAMPGGTVSGQAFERLAAELTAPLGKLAPDVVFLELHGAMVSDHYDDAEGEILRRVRDVVGPDVPILATLDLHGNISRESVETASYMTGYREYPHNDWGLTGTRAAKDLPRVLQWGKHRAVAYEAIDVVIPITSQSTYTEPAKGIYARLRQIEAEKDVALTVMMGFPPADIAICGPCVFGYGSDLWLVKVAVAELADAIRAAEPAFAAHAILPQPDAVAEARRRSVTAKGPIIIADTQDNAGAGGTSATTGMARELMAQRAEGAIVAIAHEPKVAAAAHQAGLGQVFSATLGIEAKGPGQEPLAGEFKVIALSDGKFTGTGPMLGNAPVDMGPSAVIEKDGVQIVVGTIRQQPLSQNVFEHLGIDPKTKKIIVLKSSVHYRNHFQEIADSIIVAASPGTNPADPATMPFTKLPASKRLTLKKA